MRALVAMVLSGLVLAACATVQEQPLRVAMIDAEGGAAALFVMPEGTSLLVDAGWPDGMGGAPNGPADRPSTVDRIVAAAADMGVRRIDYLLVTHYHLDHVGGVPELIARMPVGAVIDHGINREEVADGQSASPSTAAALYVRYLDSINGIPRRVVRVDDRIEIGSLSLTFVSADGDVIDAPLPAASGEPVSACAGVSDRERIGGEENRRSLGFVAAFGAARILDLGDLTWNVERSLVCPVDRLGKIDVLLISHHGSALSNSPPLIAATSPRVALIANGARKGGDESVLRMLGAAPSAPAVWQMHFATRSPDANRPERYIANLDEEADQGIPLVMEIARSGAIAVTNPRTGYEERYPALDGGR